MRNAAAVHKERVFKSTTFVVTVGERPRELRIALQPLRALGALRRTSGNFRATRIALKAPLVLLSRMCVRAYSRPSRAESCLSFM